MPPMPVTRFIGPLIRGGGERNVRLRPNAIRVAADLSPLRRSRSYRSPVSFRWPVAIAAVNRSTSELARDDLHQLDQLSAGAAEEHVLRDSASRRTDRLDG